jgi:hypothetical protein
MASGFQNTQDQLTPNFYRVTINATGWPTDAALNTSGSVEVDDFNSFATLPTTLNISRRRARGNMRWQAIIDELSQFTQPIILDITSLESDASVLDNADDITTSLAFTVGYAQEEYVLGGWQKIIGAGTFSNGATTLTTSTFEALSAANLATAVQNCIKEAVTRAITRGGASAGYTRTYRTMDPTGADSSFQEAITILQPDTPANVWTATTVSIDLDLTQTT